MDELMGWLNHYQYPVTAALVVAGGGTMWLLSEHVSKRASVIAAFSFLILVAGAGLVDRYDGSRVTFSKPVDGAGNLAAGDQQNKEHEGVQPGPIGLDADGLDNTVNGVSVSALNRVRLHGAWTKDGDETIRWIQHAIALPIEVPGGTWMNKSDWEWEFTPHDALEKYLNEKD